MAVDVIVCTYNNRAIIGRCLESIQRQTARCRCIVVDDTSSDGTADFVAKRFPRVMVIRKHAPSGPAMSRNIALCASTADFVAMVDSDVVLDRNWIAEQLACMKDERVGIAASKIVFSRQRQTLNSAGGSCTRLGFGFDRGRGTPAKNWGKSEPALYAHSAAMLVRRRVFDEIGLFDGAYGYGHEDTDLGWRANIAGWRVVYNPRAIAYHDENATVKTMTPRVAFHGTKNRLRSLIKNYDARRAAVYMPMHIAAVVASIPFISHRSAVMRGLTWNALHIGSTLRLRRRVQATRRIADSELVRLFDRRFLPPSDRRRKNISARVP